MPLLKNPKHEKFAQELAKGKTADEAYRIAGYSKHRSNAARMIANDSIRQRVAEIQGKGAERAEITVERVINELAKIGFSNMLDYLRVTGEGDAFVDLSNLTREQAAAISEVTIEDFTDGRGEDARDVRRVKFKLADKRAALVDIAKISGFVIDKAVVDHRGTVTNVNLETRDPQEAAKAYQDMIAGKT